MSDGPAYNERLFSKGLRSRLHHARFYWLNEMVEKLFDRPLSVLELGCYDAKTISFLPSLPVKYRGFDANWENGLDIARKTFNNPTYSFYECHTPVEMNVESDSYDLVLCMETIEHLPDETLEGYLEKLKTAARGIMLVTVPNEIGLVFLGKYLVKLLVYREKINPRYSFQDVLNQTLGRMDRVIHDDHKGFDYRQLYKFLSRDWDIRLYAIPFSWLPFSLGFSVGMVCVRKDRR
ncbi:MAG: class I SAM-dependent methyltransferase [Anaerolineaceae bacterium]